DFKSGNFAKSKMSMLLMDSANHRVLDIIRSRTNRFLKSYFLQYDLKARVLVKTVTVDLYSPYRKLIEDLFPNAIIIADRFHVVTQAYQALNKVRITTMKESGKDSHN
ncbi:transposase, partial [Ligilactobacillus sp. WILCCON 0076]